MRRFLITGSGRSGTQYITRVLRCHGLHVGHEAIFLPYATDRFRDPGLDAVMDEAWLQGDVSWFAVPYLRFVPESWLIVQQVRNPVRVVRSWAGLGWWENFRHLESARLVAETLGLSPDDEANPLEVYIRWWATWNQLLERPGITRWKIEEFSLDPGIMLEFIRLVSSPDAELGHVLPNHRAIRKDFGSSVHAGHKLDRSIRLKTLPPGKWKDAMIAKAIEYGYTMNELETA